MRTTYAPTASQAIIPLAHYGGGGGSGGGGGHRFIPNLAIGIEPGMNPDGSRERQSYEQPEGNLGGSGHKPWNSGPGNNGGGGGGGAGGAGQPGSNQPGSGQGGIGVAAFGGDTGIPAQYGTPGPPSVASGTRWFGGGGWGGNNQLPNTQLLNYQTDGWFGGGGVSSVASDPSFYPKDGKTNTGGGGAGARTYTPYNQVFIESAGTGGSGIVMIRYQQSL